MEVDFPVVMEAAKAELVKLVGKGGLAVQYSVLISTAIGNREFHKVQGE